VTSFDGAYSGKRNSLEDRHAVKGISAPAGANGWLLVSIHHLASASFRAIVIAATVPPR
jgi:hypothetical protein